jgi:hypothetical protein
MNTWVAQAVSHTALTSGIGVGATPAFGAASLYGFALGASATALAFAVMRAPRRMLGQWRPGDVWHHAVQFVKGRRPVLAGDFALASPTRGSRSRFRRRVDHMLLQMLGDDVDDQHSCRRDDGDGTRPSAQRDASTRPYADMSPDPDPADDARSANGYNSKHRLAGPSKESRGRKGTPRHAAPPATLTVEADSVD